MARGKIEIRHNDLIDLLFEANDSEFERTYVEAVLKGADAVDVAYYEELIQDRKERLKKAGDLVEEEEVRMCDQCGTFVTFNDARCPDCRTFIQWDLLEPMSKEEMEQYR